MSLYPLTCRLGIGTLMKELSESPRNIVYLGNSITAQRDSYRHHLHSAIVRHFRKAHKPVNAGLGGVGSLACAFLVDELVLRHNPALCFVECSAADTGGATPLDSVCPSVEGIIRQLNSAGIPMIFLHLFRKEEMAAHKQPVLEIYESLADHYGVPSINIDQLVSEQIQTGKITDNEYFHDGIHTNRKGAAYIGNTVFTLFAELVDYPVMDQVRLPEPVHPMPYQFTTILPVCEQMAEQAGSFDKKKYRELLDFTEIQPGIKISPATERFYLRGILVIADADSGVVTVETGDSCTTYQTWDEWCIISRLQVIILDQPVPPGSGVTISLSTSVIGQKGANGAPNRYERQGKVLKIIGFMMYAPFPIVKKNLF